MTEIKTKAYRHFSNGGDLTSFRKKIGVDRSTLYRRIQKSAALSDAIKGGKALYIARISKRLITHMAGGLSFESFGAVVGKSKDTLYRWTSKYPEFKEAKAIGESRSRLFWEELGIKGATGQIKGFNATSWIFNMKNRFIEWSDRTDYKETDDPLAEARRALDEEEGVNQG